jgi:uncharacterized protein YfaS (alpha-2-macroglobulin family)
MTLHRGKRGKSGRGGFTSLFFVVVLTGLLFSCGGKEASDGTDGGEGSSALSGSALAGQSEGEPSGWLDRMDQLSISYYRDAAWDNVAGGFGEEASPTGIREDGPFRLSGFGPSGDLPSEVKEPVVWVLFSQPVIPLARIGEAEKASSVISIEPQIEGQFRWYSTRMLVFQAGDKVLPQREYSVRVNESVQSVGGQSLTGGNSFSFRSEELSMLSAVPGGGSFEQSWHQGGVPTDAAEEILVRFNYPVDIETVADYLRVKAGGYTFDTVLSRPDNSTGRFSSPDIESLVMLKVTGELPGDSSISVELASGARSRSDYIGRRESQEISFHSLKPFRFLRHTTRSYSFPGDAGAANPLFLEFTHPVEKESLLKAISFDPYVPVESGNISIWGSSVRLSGLPYQFESKYIMTLGAGIRDIHGRELGSEKVVRVEIPEAASYANFPNTGTRMLEAGFPPRIVFDYQNVEDGLWKAGAIEDPYSYWPESALEPYPFPETAKNSRHFETVDLSPWLGRDRKGWVGFSWNFTPVDERSGVRPKWGQRNLTLQVTDLGLTVRYGYNRVVAWVTQLSDGKPVDGARVSLMAERDRIFEGSSDSSGLATFHLGDGEFSRYFGDSGNDWRDRLRILVEHDGDRVEFKPNNSHNLWRSSPLSVSTPTMVQKPKAEVFLFTDRGLYRPGENVTFRGIDRTLLLGEYSPYEGAYSISVIEDTWRGREIREINGTSSPSGGFHGEFEVPEDLRPGNYALNYKRSGGGVRVPFQVAEFERLKFQVGLSIPDRLYYAGDAVSAEVKASYLAGGSLSDARFDYSWTKEPAWFAPPGDTWESFRFGPSGYDRRYFLGEGDGVLGPDGSSLFRQETTPEGVEGQPQRYRGEVRVEDAGGQLISSRASVVVHPAAFYIGAKLQREGWSWFVQKGEKVNLDYVLARPDGTKYTGNAENLTLELLKRSWKAAQQQGVGGRINTRYEMVLEPVEEIALSGGTAAITPPTSGSYLVRLHGEDAAGRSAVTELSFYATGSDMVRWGYDSPEMIGLETDRPSYAPGDTAKILVKSPLPEGDYLITVEREGIFDESIVHLEGSANVIGIPISEEYLPVVYVAVSSYSVRSGKPDHSYFEPDLDKPKGYFGVVPVMVDTASRSFDIEIVSREGAYRPGEEAEITLRASRNGEPVSGAEITFLAVDRGVLDLIDYHVPDPLSFFYDPRKFPIATSGGDSRSLLIDPVTYEVKDLQGGGGDDKLERRDDFRPLAVFEPYISTDLKGEAVVRFTLPDTLTTYRCTAIGVKENNFGRSEQELVAQNPLNVNSVLPELLRHRDTVEGGLTISNLGSGPVEVELTAASDLLTVEGEASKSVTVDGESTLLVPFLFSAPSAGEGTVSFTIRSEPLNEELVKQIEVETPAVFETVATSGKIAVNNSGAKSASELLRLPGAEDGGEAPEGFLQMSLSSSRISLFEEAVAYLLDYPYDCFEQRSSMLVPYILFGETGAFPAFEELALPRAHIAAELKLMGEAQRAGGGIPYWSGGLYPSYYVSARVAQVVALAGDAGYPLPEELDRTALLAYLRRPEQRVRTNHYLYGLGLYARALLGDDVSAEARTYRQRGDVIGIAGYALAGLASVHSGDKNGASGALERISAFIRPSAATLDITETWESGASWYGSEVERLSLLLMLIQRADPENPLRERSLESLIQRRRSARWSNTVENSWALIAAAGEIGLEGAPDFSSVVSISGEVLDRSRFASIADPPRLLKFPFESAPLADLPTGTSLPLSIEAAGEGTLSYRIAMRYSIPSETAPPLDMGIGIMQEIYNLEGELVRGSSLKAGETYRIVVHLSSPLRRDFLAVRVPVPSGAVILDKGFVTTARYEGYEERMESDDESGDAPASPDRTDIMLNEARFFFDRFPQGRGEAEFMIRAVRPGIYPTPPAQAECMYEPEVLGRDGGRLLFIESRK